MFESFWNSRVIEKESKKTDEKGRVRAGILSLILDFRGSLYVKIMMMMIWILQASVPVLELLVG